ncbi:MAG TPA: hypothetical protein VFY65_20820, partial [Longimicrobium sp.]|nr:hypothetical protein [Longimicrobium sp.]
MRRKTVVDFRSPGAGAGDRDFVAPFGSNRYSRVREQWDRHRAKGGEDADERVIRVLRAIAS